LWEGGINVPMWAYWKDTIPGGQVIDEPSITLDFTATAVNLASGGIPAEFDGIDLLPHLTNATSEFARPNPLFWDWGQEIAIRKGDWKMRRTGVGDFLFNLADDPNERTNLVYQSLGKQAELESDLLAWEASLPVDGRAVVGGTLGDYVYITGAPEGTLPDPRYLDPPLAYPSAIVSPGAPVDSDGDGMFDDDELLAGRNPNHASDMAYEFNVDGDYEDWVPLDYLNYSQVSNGVLSGEAQSNQGKFEHYGYRFDAGQVDSLLVRMRSAVGDTLTFRWAHTAADVFHEDRTLTVAYSPGTEFQTVEIPLKGRAEWDGKTITRFRLNPVDTLAEFEIDWIRASWAGDSDGDGMSDADEVAAGRDPMDATDLGFEFNTDGEFEGWDWKIIDGSEDYVTNEAVIGGFLVGENMDGNRGQFENHDFSFGGDEVANMLVRVRSPSSGLVFRWATVSNDIFHPSRTLQVGYSSGEFNTVVVPMAGNTEWDGQIITQMRLNPANTPATFEVDWVRASDGDYDNDGFSDMEETVAGTNPSVGTNYFRIEEISGGTNGVFLVSVDGISGRSYTLWHALNLVSNVWNPVATLDSVPSNASYSLVDTNTAPHGFYKIDVSH